MPRIKQYADKYAMRDLASHIKGRAKENGTTQQELGAALGLSQQSVSRLFRKPETMTIAVLRKLCKVVEVDPAVILNAVGMKGVYYERGN